MAPRRAAGFKAAAALTVLSATLASCGWMAVPAPRHVAPPVTANAPQAAAPPGSVIVQPGQTLYAVARQNNVPIRAIIDANNLTPPYILRSGQQLVVPHPQVHVVTPGETLYGIARQYNVDSSALVKANDIKPPYKILIGQTLILPGQVATATSAPAPASEIRKVEMLPPQGAPLPANAPAPAAAVPSGAAPMAPKGITVTQLPPPATAAAPAAQPADATAAGASASPPAATTAAAPAAPPVASDAPTPEPAPLPPAGMAPAAVDGEGTSSSGSKLASLPPAEETAPAEAPAAGGNGRFLWPIRGKILSPFGPKEGGLYNDGINIAAKPGETVVAADSGVVAYAGNEIRGFGNLVLIKHDNGWMTAYAHNETLLVKRGERVKRGQPIAKAGSTGSVSSPQLHFEIRQGSRAVDPTKYLSSLSS